MFSIFQRKNILKPRSLWTGREVIHVHLQRVVHMWKELRLLTNTRFACNPSDSKLRNSATPFWLLGNRNAYLLLLALSSPNFAFPGCTTISRNRVSNGWTLLVFTTSSVNTRSHLPESHYASVQTIVFWELQACPGPQQRIVSVSLKSIFAKQRGASFELQKDCLKNLHGRRGFAVSCRESLKLYNL